MFNNTLKASSSSKRPKSLLQNTLAQLSTIKSSKKYYTPYKSSLKTAITNNNTLSLYSNHSKRHTKKYYSEMKTSSIVDTNKISNNKMVKNNNSSSIKNKAKEKINKKKNMNIRKNSKSLQVDQNEHLKGTQKIVSNRKLYKQLRQSFNYESTSLLLSKISEIFDLVLQKIKLPYEIQTYLFRPLQILRNRLEQKGKQQISQTLTQFKNNCMDVFKESSSSELALFQRMQLPRNNRWLISLTNHATGIKKESQMQMRIASFQNLKKKGERVNNQENETINRIQNRLDDFFCKSVKYRKVYL